MFDIKAVTKKLLTGCIIKSDSGVNMYTPDGMAKYAALWTRDFAYMVEYAGDLIDNTDIKNAIEYLLNGADQNGWIPDRVQKNGAARYTAGGPDFPALPNLDNGCFLVIAVDAFLNKLSESEATELFLKWKDNLIAGINCLPTDENGFLINNSTPLHSPYGFTDTVAKSGFLCFETLLLWKAKKALVKWLEKTNIATKELQKSIESIESNFTKIFMDKSGMLISATDQCNQIDIWASCFAISIGFPLTQSEKNNISKWLLKNYDSIVQEGQIRHLPYGEYWEKTFIPVERGTYQNGAYWAVPTCWFVDAIINYDKALALKTISDVLKDFEANGVYECINHSYRRLDTYVASATNVYGMCKKYNCI